MDKSWIALGKTPDGRMSQPYIDGVTSFIKFAMEVVNQESKIPCPCLNYVNYYSQNLRNVQIHLLQYGIMQTYTIWHERGKPRVSNEAHHEYRDMAYWFLLNNSPEIKKYLEIHKNLLRTPSDQDITRIQQQEFPKWFKERLTKRSTATKKVTNYEKQRTKTINRNRERMNALGLKNITTSLKAAVQHKKLRKEKQIAIEENDDDYQPSEGEDGNHTESNDSFEHELLEVPSRARSQSHLESLTHTPEEGDTSSRPEAGSHPSPPLNVEPQVEVTTGNTIVSAAKHVRGTSRGKEVQGIVDRYGKLNVPIPPEFRAPVGDYASKLASKIGVEVRTRLPDPSVRRWNYVDASVKGAMFQRLNKQSKTNIANREKMKTKHRCGSRSIPVREDKMAREKKMLPDLAEFYKETHYNEKTHEWISSEAQAHYENMIQTQVDHLSQPGSIPLTAEELSIKVQKPKSGYVKGLGMRPSSSIRRTTTISAKINDYVKHLEMEIETQREQIQMQNHKIEELEEGGKKQGEIMADVVNFLRSKGFTGHFGNGGDSSPSGHISWPTCPCRPCSGPSASGGDRSGSSRRFDRMA